jgi:two-component system, NarL family, sensor kinase
MRRSKQSDSSWVRRFSELQSRLLEAEDTLNAIRNGTVDALVVRTPRGEQLFTLKGADQTYRVLVEGMNEGALTLRRGIISYCNKRFAEMSGTKMEKVFGASVFDFISAPGLSPLMKRLEKGTGSNGVIEGELRAADRTTIPVRLSASRFQSEGLPMVSIVLTDMTAQMAAQEASQELSRKIINAQEQERQRVARDLHDSVNQLLSTARYRLGSLVARNAGRNDTKDLHLVRGVIEKALGEVRTISRNLRPSELDDLGLFAAMRSLVREFRDRSGINARFSHDPPECPLQIPKEVELTVYRIAQEALNNVEKHSRAANVTISLTCPRNTHVALVVRDDGKGFVPAERKGAGWGLQNITERAGLLKGNVKVESAHRKGAKISVDIPLKTESRVGGPKAK